MVYSDRETLGAWFPTALAKAYIEAMVTLANDLE